MSSSEELFEAITSDDVDTVSYLLEDQLSPFGSFQDLPPGAESFGVLPIPYINVACAFGSTKVVEYLLSANVSLSEPDGHGNEAIHAAAVSGNNTLVEILISYGADEASVNNDGDTPLHFAADFGCSDVILSLITHGGDPNIIGANGQCPLHRAVISRSVSAIQLLLQNNADPTRVDEDGNTVLHLSAMNGNDDFVSGFLEVFEGPINRQNHKGETILMLAARHCQSYSLLRIINAGGSLALLDKRGASALHHAAMSRNPENVTIIRDWLPNMMSLPDSYNYVPLHYAAKFGPLESVFLLHGDDSLLINHQFSGFSPCFFAIKHSHIDIVRFFYSHRLFNPSFECMYYHNPLHIAARTTSSELLSFLLSTNLYDVNIADVFGWTPLHFAALKGTKDMVANLILEGAQTEIFSNDNRTPYDIAEQRGATNIMTLLQEAE